MIRLDEYHFQCLVCGLVDQHKLDCQARYEKPQVLPEEEDWLAGVTCNPDAPEECESCQ